MPDIIDNTISPGKIFITNRSRLEGRIDPNPYHFERIDAIRELRDSNELLKLSDVVKSVKTQTADITENQIYVGLENIISNTGEYLPSAEKQSISSAGVFKKGQILFPKLRPYLNKVYLAEFDGICSTEFHIFDSITYRNEFLAIYLRSDLIVSQTKHLMTGNTLPRLQTEDIKRLPVPKITLEKQDVIVARYKETYIEKQNKDRDARLLLVSTDAYMMDKLGVNLPKKDSTLPGRIYSSSFSDLAGNRFDPELDLYNKQVHLFKYETVKLKKLLLKKPQYGANESGIPRMNKLEPRYVRITDIDEYGQLDDEIGVTAERIEQKYILNDNDLIFARSGATVGKCYLHKSDAVDYKAFFAGYMIRFVVDTRQVIPEYLFFYTQSEVYRRWVKAIQRAAGQPNINAEEYRSLPIPLPPLNVQQELVDHIKQVRQTANELHRESLAILANAKASVEREILHSKFP